METVGSSGEDGFVFLEADSESEPVGLGFDETGPGAGCVSVATAESLRANTSKWKSTESAQERKTIAFMTEPRRAKVRFNSAVSVTRRCFAGTTI